MRDDNDMKTRMINEKLEFYCKSKNMVHIELMNKRFLNARVIEKSTDNIWIVNDRKLGILHLFVSEVWNISEFVEGKHEM